MKANWIKATLEEVCLRITDGAHQSPKSVEKGFPMASVKDLTPYGIQLATCRHISPEDFEKLVRQGCQPEPGDVLIAKDGNSALDTVCEVKQKDNLVLLSSVAILRPNTSKITSSYLRYFLDCESTRQYLKSGFITGAAIPRVILKNFKRSEICFPPLPIQRKIAGILSAYDRLIENNTRRIEILEEMARSLYREWFVNFRYPGHEKVQMVDSELGLIPEKWEVKNFGEVSLNFDSKRKPLSSIQRAEMKGEYPYYGASGIIDYVENYILDGKYLLISEDGENLNSRKKPIAFFAYKKFWVNNHAHIVQGKPPISTEFLYLLISDLNIAGYITGAAQPKFSQANLNRIPLVVPTDDLLKLFNQIAENLLNQIEILGRKNANLRQTRDLLLPRLISGEIDVENLDINTGPIAA